MHPLVVMIKKHVDRVLFILALLILAVTLVLRLGGKKVIAMAAAPTLVFTQWWQEKMDEGVLESLIKEFEALHPDIRVALEYQSYESIYSSLMDGSAGEGGGDILALDPLWAAALAEKGALAEESYPLLTYVNPLFYNIDILRAAGFSGPPKTREEFLSAARAVKKLGGGHYGIALAAGTDTVSLLRRDIYPWIWAAGKPLIAEGKPLLTGQPFIETLEFLGTLNSEDLLVPESFSWGEDQQREAFVEGRTAFMIAPVMEIEALKHSMAGGFGVSAIPVPGGYASRPVFGAGGWNLGISSRSQYREEAKTFIVFLLEQSGRIAVSAHAIPGSGLSLAAGEDPLYTKVSDLCVSAEFLREFEGLPAVGDLENRFRFFMAEFLRGKLGAAAAAEQIQKSWEALLARQ